MHNESQIVIWTSKAQRAMSLTSKYCTYAYRKAMELYFGKQIGEKDSDVLH